MEGRYEFTYWPEIEQMAKYIGEARQKTHDKKQKKHEDRGAANARHHIDGVRAELIVAQYVWMRRYRYEVPPLLADGGRHGPDIIVYVGEAGRFQIRKRIGVKSSYRVNEAAHRREDVDFYCFVIIEPDFMAWIEFIPWVVVDMDWKLITPKRDDRSPYRERW